MYEIKKKPVSLGKKPKRLIILEEKNEENNHVITMCIDGACSVYRLLINRTGRYFQRAASQEATDAPASADESTSTEASGGSADGVQIAYINALVTTPYFGYLDAAMTEHAQELGVDLQILDGQADNQVMLDQAQSLIDQKDVDAIIFTPCDMAGSVSIVQAISDAGIPLIICNTRVDESVENLTQSLICCDPTYEGEVVGQLAVEQCPEGGKCITLEGFAGQEAQIYRTEGFKNGIEGSKIEIVDQKICDWDKAKAMSATDDMITAYPDLAIIFAQDDTMAEGAIEAVKAAGKQDQIKVFGLGYMGDESKEALLSGELCGTCTQSPSGKALLPWTLLWMFWTARVLKRGIKPSVCL